MLFKLNLCFRCIESIQRDNIKYLDEIINYWAQRACNERLCAKLEFHAVLCDVFVSFCRSKAARGTRITTASRQDHV